MCESCNITGDGDYLPRGILVKSQEELEKINITDNIRIFIDFGTADSPAIITEKYYLDVVTIKDSYTEAYNDSVVDAWDGSFVTSYDNSEVDAWSNSTVIAKDNSIINAHFGCSVEGYNNSLKVGYLVCQKCGGYYQLQPGESPEDFTDECDCGGHFECRTTLYD